MKPVAFSSTVTVIISFSPKVIFVGVTVIVVFNLSIWYLPTASAEV